MDQPEIPQNKTSIFSKNQIFVTVGLIIAVAAIVIVANRTKPGNDDRNTPPADQNSEQVMGENTNSDTSPSDSGQPNQTQSENGQVKVSGTLRASDNSARGNLMLESDKGKIYISTKRDFSALVGKSADLTASGTLDKFVFISLSATGADMGGSNEPDQQIGKPAEVKFTGKLQASDNTATGNYMLISGSSKVYLKSSQDYSSLVGSDVVLTAAGTLNSFTGARLVKK